MSALLFAEKVALERGEHVMLYRGITDDNIPFFAYLRCNKDGIEKLHHDYEVKAKDVDISTYGKIIYLDFKEEPDAQAEDYLEGYIERVRAIAELEQD